MALDSLRRCYNSSASPTKPPPHRQPPRPWASVRRRRLASAWSAEASACRAARRHRPPSARSTRPISRRCRHRCRHRCNQACRRRWWSISCCRRHSSAPAFGRRLHPTRVPSSMPTSSLRSRACTRPRCTFARPTIYRPRPLLPIVETCHLPRCLVASLPRCRCSVFVVTDLTRHSIKLILEP